MIFYTIPNLPVYAEDTESNDSVVLYEKAFMGVGDRCNFDWLINVDSYYFTVTDTAIAESDRTNGGYIIGKAPGTTTVSLTYMEGNVIKYGQFQLEVFENAVLDSYLYHIRSAVPAKKYTLFPDNGLSTAIAKSYSDDIFLTTKWSILSNENGQFSLYSPIYNSYLCVLEESLKDNATPVLVSSFSEDKTYWNILRNDEGKYLLVPDCNVETNLVLSVPTDSTSDETSLLLTNYYDYSDIKHDKYKMWHMFPEELTIHNYYDSSIANQPTLYNLILEACDFAIGALYNSKTISIKKDTIITSYITSADECMQGNDSDCTEACDVDCSNHHKNRANLLDQVSAIPHDNNHVNVLWMDRPLAAYCNKINGEHATSTGEIAMRGEGIPIYTISTIGNVDTAQAYETMMGIVLTHEIAHLYGLPEQYQDESHCKDESGKQIHCCMDYAYYNNDIQDFYDNVAEGLEDVFCPDCMDLMSDYMYLFHQNNYTQ